MVLSERDSKGGNTHTLEDSPIRGDRRGEGGGETGMLYIHTAAVHAHES